MCGGPAPSRNVSKVTPSGHCESEEGSADGLGDGGGAGEASSSLVGAGVGEPSDSADGSKVQVGRMLMMALLVERFS